MGRTRKSCKLLINSQKIERSYHKVRGYGAKGERIWGQSFFESILEAISAP